MIVAVIKYHTDHIKVLYTKNSQLYNEYKASPNTLKNSWLTNKVFTNTYYSRRFAKVVSKNKISESHVRHSKVEHGAGHNDSRLMLGLVRIYMWMHILNYNIILEIAS